MFLRDSASLWQNSRNYIDSPISIRYKVYMNFLKKSAWLGLMIVVTACQNFPIPLPLPTAAPTNTQGPPPTPTAPPSPTPLPTMEPIVRIDTGDQALFYGDFDLAREQYLAAFNDTTDDAIKAYAQALEKNPKFATRIADRLKDLEKKTSAEKP